MLSQQLNYMFSVSQSI